MFLAILVDETAKFFAVTIQYCFLLLFPPAVNQFVKKNIIILNKFQEKHHNHMSSKEKITMAFQFANGKVLGTTAYQDQHIA